MIDQEWIRAGEYAIQVHDAQVQGGRRGNFRAVEIAPVGRTRRHYQTGDRVTLAAPPPAAMALALLLRDEVLEWVREVDGPAPIHVSSWYRDPVYNASIRGAAPSSLHTRGAAADITKRGWTPSALAEALKEHPRADELGIGLYPTFVHVDIRGMIGSPAPARWGGAPWFWA